jgi:mycoredoxin
MWRSVCPNFGGFEKNFDTNRLGIAEGMIKNDAQFSGAPQDASAGETDTPVLMYTTPWCGDCWRAKQVMDSMKVKYTEIDIAVDEEAAEVVMRLNGGYRSVPTIVFPDGTVMTEPRTSALVEKLQNLLQ